MQWKRAGPELERFRYDELRRAVYDWTTVDALLEVGDRIGKSRDGAGMIEMQRLFMKAARQQGLLPAERVRETSPAYETGAERSLGNVDLLRRRKLALLCSVRCPGRLATQAYDLAQRWRDAGVAVVSGFHSPMEQECRRILLRSPHPVVWCLARGLPARLPPELRKPVAEGRLLIVTPFSDKVRHATAVTSAQCNRAVADMAALVFVVHAAPGSKTEALSLALLAAGKPLYTFDDPANAALLQAGAQPARAETDWRELLAGR